MTLINPYGINYWHYLINALTMQRPFITEWLPLNPFENFYKVIGIKIQLLLLIPAFVYIVINKGRQRFLNVFNSVDWVEIIAFAVTLYLGFKHCRHIIFFSIVVAVYGYKYFVIFMDAVFNKIKVKNFSLIPERKHNLIYFAKYTFIYSFMISICLLMIFKIPHEINLSFYPVKAVEFIKINKLKGNLLVPFNWGSYALWKLYPQNLVSIDGRYEETYTNEAYLDVSKIIFCHKDWKKTFYKYHHDVILINKDCKFQRALRKLKEWKPVYEDEKVVIFIPSLTPEKKWLQPNRDEKYYIKTKYENNINF
jgi:hypothetical protein